MTKPLLTITGPSGSGKTEILKILCAVHNFDKLVSVTTRDPRPGEVEGDDYYFISKDEFERLGNKGKLLQEVCFGGKYYGTTSSELDRISQLGKVPAVIVEPGGITQFQKIAQAFDYKVKSAFISADLDTLVKRYLERLLGETITESFVSTHTKRLASMGAEVADWPRLAKYDISLYNAGSFESLKDLAQQISYVVSKKEA